MKGLIRNSTADSFYVWEPGEAWPDLPTVCGPFRRVNEWLEEVGVLREGVKLIAGGTSFNFQQTIQAQDADGASLTNSATETALATTVSFLGSGTGTVGVGGFFSEQKTLGIHFRGAVSSASSTPGNFNLNLRQDSTSGTTGGAQTAYALATSLATSPVALDAYLTCRAVGTAGNVESMVEYTPAATPASNTNVRQLARANIGSFDTTGNRSFLVDGLFSSALAANVALAKIFIVEVLN
jgi:hypothetical protein